MRQRPFLKTFLQRKSFFAPNVIWYYFGQILKSEVIFYFLDGPKQEENVFCSECDLVLFWRNPEI